MKQMSCQIRLTICNKNTDSVNGGVRYFRAPAIWAPAVSIVLVEAGWMKKS